MYFYDVIKMSNLIHFDAFDVIVWVHLVAFKGCIRCHSMNLNQRIHLTLFNGLFATSLNQLLRSTQGGEGDKSVPKIC